MPKPSSSQYAVTSPDSKGADDSTSSAPPLSDTQYLVMSWDYLKHTPARSITSAAHGAHSARTAPKPPLLLEHAVTSALCLGDGSVLVLGTQNSRLMLVEYETFAIGHQYTLPTPPARSAAAPHAVQTLHLTADHTTLLAASGDTVFVFAVISDRYSPLRSTLIPKYTLTAPLAAGADLSSSAIAAREIVALSASSDSRYVVCADRSYTLWYWDIRAAVGLGARRVRAESAVSDAQWLSWSVPLGWSVSGIGSSVQWVAAREYQDYTPLSASSTTTSRATTPAPSSRSLSGSAGKGSSASVSGLTAGVAAANRVMAAFQSPPPTVSLSKSRETLVVGERLGRVKLFRYPCLAQRVGGAVPVVCHVVLLILCMCDVTRRRNPIHMQLMTRASLTPSSHTMTTISSPRHHRRRAAAAGVAPPPAKRRSLKSGRSRGRWASLSSGGT